MRPTLVAIVGPAVWLGVSGPCIAEPIRIQTFDSAASATAQGWTVLRNTTDGNNFGFRSTNLTAGPSGPGEAGGTVARTPGLSYYADATLAGPLTLADPIRAAGELFVPPFFGNNAIRVGHFDASDTLNPYDFLGFQVAEPEVSPPTQIRVIAYAYLANGDRVGTATPLSVAPNTAYTWSYTWSPADSLLTVEVFDSAGGSLGTSLLGLSPAQRAIGVSLTGFGLSTGGIGDADPANRTDVFIDNLSYTAGRDAAAAAIPEPSSLLTLGACCMALTGWAWTKQRVRQANKVDKNSNSIL
jgi:hypothetical protein